MIARIAITTGTCSFCERVIDVRTPPNDDGAARFTDPDTDTAITACGRCGKLVSKLGLLLVKDGIDRILTGKEPKVVLEHEPWAKPKPRPRAGPRK